MSKLQQKNIDLEAKLDEAMQQLDRMYINRKSESALLLEIEHLKDDNVRLIKGPV